VSARARLAADGARNDVRQASAGLREDARQAKEKLFGEDGVVTQVAEVVPGVADALMHIHRKRGHTSEAEERARAYTLRKMFGSEGAVIKVWELMPGLNLLAAAVLDAQGDKEQAEEAMHLVRNWKHSLSPHGALARVAELLPGIDVVWFGIMLQQGHFASALRVVTKTRWVDVKAGRIALVVRCGRVADWEVFGLKSDLVIAPKSRSLTASLLDLLLNFFEINAAGEKRSWIRKFASAQSLDELSTGFRDRVNKGSELKAHQVTKALQMGICAFTRSVPTIVDESVDLINWARNDWIPVSSWAKRVMIAYRCFAPSLASASDGTDGFFLVDAIQKALPSCTAYHQPMPKSAIPPRTRAQRRIGLPEVAATVSCVSVVGCLGFGMHTGFVACLAGCVAGLGAAHRTVKKNLVSWLNRSNAYVWEWMSEPVQPIAKQGEDDNWPDVGTTCPPWLLKQMPEREKSLAQPASPQPPVGLVFEFPELDVYDAGTYIRGYILNQWYRRHWLGWLLWAFERPLLLKFLNDAFSGGGAEVAIPIPVPAGSSSLYWLPDIRVLLILELNWSKKPNYVRKVKVAMVDGQVEQIAHTLRRQLLPEDLRELDPRLEEFSSPIELELDFHMEWPQDQNLHLEFSNVHMRLDYAD